MTATDKGTVDRSDGTNVTCATGDGTRLKVRHLDEDYGEPSVYIQIDGNPDSVQITASTWQKIKSLVDGQLQVAPTPVAAAVGGDEQEANAFVALVKEELSDLRARIATLESKE